MIWWKWVLAAAAVPVGAAIIIYGVGLALPEDHLAASSATIARPVAQVAAIVRDVEGQPRWRKGVTAIDVIERSGNSIRYIERQGADAITFEMSEEQPDALFRSVIADPALPFGGQWTIKLASVGEGTRVTIEERGSVKHPVYRFFSKVLFGHDSTMKAYLADLRAASSA